MSVGEGAAATPRRSRWPVVRLAWVAAAILMAVLLLGGAMVAAAMGERTSPHAVLDVQLVSRSFGAAGADEPVIIELWTDPTLARARLILGREQTTLYYLHDSSGAWYSVGQTPARSPWQRTRLAARAAPALLSLEEVRALFAHMRARASRLTWVGLHNRLAVAFPATVLPWPYYYAGRATVWLDGVTGLPLQFRLAPAGASHAFVITVVNRIRSVQSSTLPSGFLAPPDQTVSAWDCVVRRVASLIHDLGVR